MTPVTSWRLHQPHEWRVQFELGLGYPDQVVCLGDIDTLGPLIWRHVMFPSLCLAVMSQCF